MKAIDLNDSSNYRTLQRISFQTIRVDQLYICIHGLRYDEGNHKKTRAHRHSFYELHYITDGHITTTINGITREYGAGSFYLIPPYSTHSHENMQPPHSHVSFAIRWTMEIRPDVSGNPELEYMSREIEKASPMPMIDRNGRVADIFRQMIVYSRLEHAQTEVKMLFVALLKELGAQYANAFVPWAEDEVKSEGATREIINAAVAYIYANCMSNIDVNDIARHVHVSYSHLARLFAQHAKQSINGYIIQIRIDHAQHMLLTSNESIEEITTQLGFSSVSHFSNTFKRLTGLSPKLFRSVYGQGGERDIDPTIM